jgi:hypothetical protein
MGTPRKSGLPSFYKELEKLLGDKAKPPVPPTNVVQPLAMPMVDMAYGKNATALSTFENGVLKIPAGAVNMEGMKELLEQWKKSSKTILDTMGTVIVNFQEEPDGSTIISLDKVSTEPQKIKGAKAPLPDVYGKSLLVPDPLVEQLQQELEKSFQDMVGLKVGADMAKGWKQVGHVHDELFYELGEPMKEIYHSGNYKQEILGTFKAYQNEEQDFGQNPCKEIYLKDVMKETSEKVEASKQAMMGGTKGLLKDLYAAAEQAMAGPPLLLTEAQKQVLASKYLNYEDVYSFKNEQKKFAPNYALQELQSAALIAGLGVPAEFLNDKVKQAFPVVFDPPEAVELVELTISGLTQKEAEKIMKQVRTNEKPVLTSKKVLKDIGTGAKAVITWDFESSSMAVNGAVVKYITQLNTDGTVSCQCHGYIIQKKNSDGANRPKSCKHTKAIEKAYDVKSLFKKWKKGEPLGADFEPKESGNVEIKTLGATQPIVYTSKRVVEI